MQQQKQQQHKEQLRNTSLISAEKSIINYIVSKPKL